MGGRYAILRTQKLKSAVGVRRSLQHAFREQETPNSDPGRIQENAHIGARSTAEALERFNERLPEKVRKNAVLAIEYLVTASPEAMRGKSRSEQNAYFKDALEWLREKHGKENVFYAGVHRDESTPHMYAYVVPIDAAGKLNCRSFLGGSKALSGMQTDFADKVGKRHGLERGVERSKAKHQAVRTWYARQQQAEREASRAVKTPGPVDLDLPSAAQWLIAPGRSRARLEAEKQRVDKMLRQEALKRRQMAAETISLREERDKLVDDLRRAQGPVQLRRQLGQANDAVKALQERLARSEAAQQLAEERLQARIELEAREKAMKEPDRSRGRNRDDDPGFSM